MSVVVDCTGILAGLVSITAGCASVEPYGAAIIGSIGGLVYYTMSTVLKKCQIDDPLDASPVHFFCGIWGVVAVGLFATPANLLNVYESKRYGSECRGGGGGKEFVSLLWQLFQGLHWRVQVLGIENSVSSLHTILL